MWWLVWILSYLGFGSLFAGAVAIALVRANKLDLDDVSLGQMLGIMLFVLLWPILVCLVVVLLIAHMVKPEPETKGDAP